MKGVLVGTVRYNMGFHNLYVYSPRPAVLQHCYSNFEFSEQKLVFVLNSDTIMKVKGE